MAFNILWDDDINVSFYILCSYNIYPWNVSVTNATPCIRNVIIQKKILLGTVQSTASPSQSYNLFALLQYNWMCLEGIYIKHNLYIKYRSLSGNNKFVLYYLTSLDKSMVTCIVLKYKTLYSCNILFSFFLVICCFVFCFYHHEFHFLWEYGWKRLDFAKLCRT